MSLLHSELKVITEWIPDGVIVAPFDFEINALNRCDLIEDFYQSRLSAMDKDSIEYRPVPPEQMYLTQKNLKPCLKKSSIILSPFSSPEKISENDNNFTLSGEISPVFSATQDNYFSPSQSAAQMIKKEIKNRYVILVAASKGAVAKMIELISSNLSISIIPMGAGVVQL
ncbi:MAG: hypothetical protein CM15mP117_22070 [Alphaproteobacteria bacterium]|nr:MAG: hypothetical protein CM15mP117_22070 [Alphaproteobacteria bacterium]